jgi:uncharacterized membrane protein (DUF2068 family)
MSARDPRRTRRVLRLIAAERFLRGLLLLGAGAYLLFHVSSDFGSLADRLIRRVELDPREHYLHELVNRLHRLRPGELRTAGLVALGYGGLELVEGAGLWLDQLWAEYLTIIATSLLVPLEVYELVHRPSFLKAGGLIVNLLIVGYLVYALRQRLARERRSAVARR